MYDQKLGSYPFMGTPPGAPAQNDPVREVIRKSVEGEMSKTGMQTPEGDGKLKPKTITPITQKGSVSLPQNPLT